MGRARALVVLLLVLGSACSGLPARAAASPTPPKPTAQLLSDATDALTRAGSLHVRASVKRMDVGADLDYDEKLGGASQDEQAQGTLSLEGTQFDLLVAGGKSFARGRDSITKFMGERVARQVGDRWLLVGQKPLTQVAHLLEVGSFLVAINHDVATLKRQDGQLMSGHRVTHLASQDAEVFIATDGPNLPLRWATVGSGSFYGYQRLVADFTEYGKTVKVDSPGAYADLGDPKTLPPRYTYEASSFGFNSDCQGRSDRCGMFATFRNQAGKAPAPAPSTALFTLSEQGGGTLGTCTVELPVVDFGQATSVGCVVDSQEWKNFTARGGTYVGRVKASNPAYD